MGLSLNRPNPNHDPKGTSKTSSFKKETVSPKPSISHKKRTSHQEETNTHSFEPKIVETQTKNNLNIIPIKTNSISNNQLTTEYSNLTTLLNQTESDSMKADFQTFKRFYIAASSNDVKLNLLTAFKDELTKTISMLNKH